ncbi:hypothetical protein ACGFIR_30185 [Micromonospora sp. NPDC049051]|uniref:hypothetical protein n=1 Tax=Micromonospora sp. NPDC049051 TaxID=3364264 RepID=UPI0037204619
MAVAPLSITGAGASTAVSGVVLAGAGGVGMTGTPSRSAAYEAHRSTRSAGCPSSMARMESAATARPFGVTNPRAARATRLVTAASTKGWDSTTALAPE